MCPMSQDTGLKEFLFLYPKMKELKKTVKQGEKPSYLQLCSIWLMEWTNQQKYVIHVKLQCLLDNLKA